MRRILAILLLMLPCLALAQTTGAPPIPPSQWQQNYIPTLNDWHNLLGSNSPLDAATVMGRTMDARATDIIRAADTTYAGGVKCDGVTDDSPALQAALNAGSALGGRTVLLPATGHACLLKEGIAISDAAHSGNTLEGTAHGMYWPGPYDNTEAHWTQFGTWIHCADLNNSCITMNGNGSAMRHLSFWYTQPTPAEGGCGAFCNMTHEWSPTQYPFTITVGGTQNFNALSDINVVNGTNCIDFEGGSTGVNTIFTYAEHMHLGCFNTVAKFNRIDNIIDIHDWHDNLWWFPFASGVVGYTEGDTSSPGHKIGWDAYYLANLQGTGIEFYQDATPIRITDATVGSGLGNVTIGMQDVSLANVDFNQDCQAVAVTSGTTHVLRDSMVGVHVNIDPQTSNGTQCAAVHPNAFDLSTSNLNMQIAQLQVGFAQTIAAIGAPGTTGGTLHINGMSADNYSAYMAGGSAFLLQGGYLDAPGGYNWIFTQNSSAGPRVAGSPGQNETYGQDITGQAGTPRQLRFLTEPANGSNFPLTRWGVRTDSSTESGQNSGSNWNLDRYGDQSQFLDSPIEVSRATGQVFMSDGIKAVLPTSCTGQATGTLWNNASAVGICP